MNWGKVYGVKIRRVVYFYSLFDPIDRFKWVDRVIKLDQVWEGGLLGSVGCIYLDGIKKVLADFWLFCSSNFRILKCKD